MNTETSYCKIMLILSGMMLGMTSAQVLAEEFEVADIFFELNNTDGDLGIHALIDGGPWEQVRIRDEDGKKLLQIQVKKTLRKQGMTELFFESAEPSFDDLAPEDFFARFPPGFYEITGQGINGEELENHDEVSHKMPAPPANIAVNDEEAVEDCDVELPVVTAPVTLSWDAVTLSHPDLGETNVPVEVTNYQVVVEAEVDGEDFALSVDLPPAVTSFEIPEDFTDLETADGEFKFEILVREATGNQTATESCFELANGEDEDDDDDE